MNEKILKDNELKKVVGGAAKIVAAEDAAATNKSTVGVTPVIVKNGKKFTVTGEIIK